jgi:signal transduction histidine kinase
VSRLYLRIYAALLAVIVVFFASAALLLWQRDGGPEQEALTATTALAELLLPPHDAEPGAQAAAVTRIAGALGTAVALFDAEGGRLAESGGFVPLPRIERGVSHALMGAPSRRGVVLRLADGRWLAVRAPAAPHRHAGLLAGLALLATLIGVAAYPVARGLVRRIEALGSRVDAFGRGDLSARVEVAGRDEVAKLAASFNQAASRIEALVATQRTLLASASHALRSPLARLRVAAELLADGPSAERAVELREQLAREVSSLDAAVEELLAVSRLELGAASSSPVDLLALAAEEGARVGAEVTGAPTELLGDARSLRHLLRNLLDNARRHAAGELELSVTPLDATRADGGALLRVLDRGPGIPEAERESIFEPFVKGSAAAAGGDRGVGLGLAIVRQIARHHGGDVCARPRAGGGSVFEVTLPGQKADVPSPS